MATLEKLENLKNLCLDYDGLERGKTVWSLGGFPGLESISLFGLEKLKPWRVEEGALQSLCRLLISYRYKLRWFDTSSHSTQRSGDLKSA